MRKILSFSLGCFLLASFAALGWLLSSTERTNGMTSIQPGDLIKGSNASVYYYGSDQKRYVFPNAATYATWYANFSSVKTISDTDLGLIPLGNNVTYRPGVKLVKVTTNPKVYAVSKGGVLRHVASETIASALYGANWASQVEDIPDAFFSNYRVGDPIISQGDYNRVTAQSTSPTIMADKSLAAQTTVSVDVTKLPLGDNKKSTTPTRGYIYLCNVPMGMGGAFAAGPWIHGDTWNLNEKIKVDGSVSWPSASISSVIQGVMRSILGNALPSHPTGVYPISSSDDAYRYDRNPNRIQSQSVQLSLPANPVVASSPSCIGGEVGIALSGVPIFNGFDAGQKDAVAHEIQDECNGHPQREGVYHYHGPSPCVNNTAAQSNGEAKLFGYALDGFGIYENQENGKNLSNDDLDECHGHSHEIEWNGVRKTIYHYHLTNEFPYTVGCFKGTPVQRKVTSM